MNVLAARAGPWLLVFGLLSPCPCFAQLLAQSRLSFTDFQITPSSGMVVFDFPWFAQTVASESDLAGTADATGDGSTPAFASYSSQYGISAAIANPALLSTLARSRVAIPAGIEAFSLATGRGSLDGYFNFRIEDETNTGTVTVTFSGIVAGILAVSTDELGVFATTETTFALDLYDGTVDDQLALVRDSIFFRRDVLSIGPSASLPSSFAVGLGSQAVLGSTATRELQLGVSYRLFFEADSESQGLTAVPESSHYGLTALALVLLKFVLRRRKPASGLSP